MTRSQRRRSQRARNSLVVGLAALVGIGLGSGGVSLALWSDEEVLSGSVSAGYEYFAAGHLGEPAPADSGVATVSVGEQEAKTLLEDGQVAVPLQTESLSQGRKGLRYRVSAPTDWGDNVFSAARINLFLVESPEECTPNSAPDASEELASTPVSAIYSEADEPVVEYWCLTAALEERPGEGTYRNTGSVTATDPSGTTVQDKDEWHAALTSDLDPGVEPDHAIEFLYSTFRSEEEAP